MLKSKKIISISILSLLCILPFQSVIASSDYNSYSNEIQSKGKEVVEKGSQITNNGIDMKKYQTEFKAKLPVDLPTGFQIKEYNLNQYDSLIPQLGQFKAFSDNDFKKNLAEYQNMYDNKKSQLIGTYNSKESQIETNKNNALSKYNTDTKTLQNQFSSEKNNLQSQYNSGVDSLNKNYDTNNLKAKTDTAKSYEDNKSKLLDTSQSTALIYWNPNSQGTITNEFNTKQQEYADAKVRIAQFQQNFDVTLKQISDKIDNYDPSKLKQELENLYPNFLDTYPAIVAPIGFGQKIPDLPPLPDEKIALTKLQNSLTDNSSQYVDIMKQILKNNSQVLDTQEYKDFKSKYDLINTP
jgi:hypothetical protein